MSSVLFFAHKQEISSSHLNPVHSSLLISEWRDVLKKDMLKNLKTRWKLCHVLDVSIDCDNRTRHAVMKENISWNDSVL